MPIVNFIREHRRFIQYASDEKLTANERVLWYALMEIMNQQADGNVWPGGFIRVSNDRVLTLCDPMSNDTLERARNRLKQRGLIEYMPGERRKSNPAYKMNYFCPEDWPQNACNPKNDYPQNACNPKNDYPQNAGKSENLYPQNADYSPFNPQKADKKTFNPHFAVNPAVNMGGNMGGKVPPKPADIYPNEDYIYNNTKGAREDEDEDEDEDPLAGTRTREGDFDEMDDGGPAPEWIERKNRIRRDFAAAFGRKPYPAEEQKIITAASLFGMSADMTALACQTAAENGARKPAEYIIAVMEDWNKAHVKQPGQVGGYRAEYDTENGRNGLYPTGDVIEDMRIAREARERRAEENRAAGIE